MEATCTITYDSPASSLPPQSAPFALHQSASTRSRRPMSCVQGQGKQGKAAARLPEDDDTGEGLERKQVLRVRCSGHLTLPGSLPAVTLAEAVNREGSRCAGRWSGSDAHATATLNCSPWPRAVCLLCQCGFCLCCTLLSGSAGTNPLLCARSARGQLRL